MIFNQCYYKISLNASMPFFLFFVYFSFFLRSLFFCWFMTEKDLKTLKKMKHSNFDQRTACGAPVRWSKYPTPITLHTTMFFHILVPFTLTQWQNERAQNIFRGAKVTPILWGKFNKPFCTEMLIYFEQWMEIDLKKE